MDDDRIKHGSRTYLHECPYTMVLPAGYRRDRPWPLVIALHGMGQIERVMQRRMAPLLDRPWMWLFPRGVHPFEMRRPEKARIGHAWYLYTGDQDQLRESMETTMGFLLAMHDLIRFEYPVSSTAVVGFSQGGYLAGYLGAANHGRFRAAASISGRLKWEFFKDAPAEAKEELALAQFHGGKDQGVKPELAKEAVENTRKAGFKDVEYFEDPEAGHEISPKMVEDLGHWLEGRLK